MPIAFQEATRKYIEAGKDLEGKGFDPRKLLNPGFEAIKATVKEKWNYSDQLTKLIICSEKNVYASRRFLFVTIQPPSKQIPFLGGFVNDM